MPRLSDDADYAAALDNRNRLANELQRLTDEIQDFSSRRSAVVEDEGAQIERVLRGDKPAPRLKNDERVAELRRVRKLTVAAMEKAEAELRTARTRARQRFATSEWAKQTYRARVRQSVLAYVQLAKEMQALSDLHDAMEAADLPIDSPLPPLAHGDPRDSTSFSAYLIGSAIEAGYLDPKADADLLAGTTPYITPPSPPAPAPRPPKPMRTMRQALKSLGFPAK